MKLHFLVHSKSYLLCHLSGLSGNLELLYSGTEEDNGYYKTSLLPMSSTLYPKFLGSDMF